MVQLLVIGAVLVGGWYAWKALRREMDRVSAEVEAVRKPPSKTLRHDPATGRYKVDERD